MPRPFGYHHSEETKKKMSAAQKGRSLKAEHINKLKGCNNHGWKGGRCRSGDPGYYRILCPNHPCADKNGYVLEHRLVMEAHLGRVLLPSEIVHHINHNVRDNRIENLMLFPSRKEHSQLHRKERRSK